MLAGPAGAQSSGSAQLSIGGGVATDTRGVRSGVLTVSPSVIVSSPARWFFANASASRFGQGASALGGQLGLGGRAAIASTPFGLTFASGGSFTRASYGATFAQAEATPALEARHRSLVASAGVRASAATSSIPVNGGGPFGSVTGAKADSTRSMIAAVFAGGVRGHVLENGALFDALYREERGAVRGVGIVDRAVTLGVAKGLHAFNAAAGMRSARDEQVAFGSVGATLGLGRGAALQLAAGRYASNRLTGVPGGSFASAGLMLRFGMGRGLAPGGVAPSPAGVAAPAPGRTRVAIRAPRATRVEVAGDWNGWRAVPAQRAANGVWYVDLELAPGRYRYAFRVDGSRWSVPEGVPAEDDGLGGRTAWLTVGRA